jgi:hypothetical protein
MGACLERAHSEQKTVGMVTSFFYCYCYNVLEFKFYQYPNIKLVSAIITNRLKQYYCPLSQRREQ